MEWNVLKIQQNNSMCNGVERVKDPRTTQCVMEWNVLKIQQNNSMCNGVEHVKDPTEQLDV